MSIPNRRKYYRVPFREDITVDGTKMCTSIDISEGGIYISAIQIFEENSILELSIPFKGDELKVKARVVYIQPGIGMGLEFIDLSGEQKKSIRELIESLQK